MADRLSYDVRERAALFEGDFAQRLMLLRFDGGKKRDRVMALTVGLTAPAAQAGSGTDVALGLASFAVFNQVFGSLLAPRVVHAAPVVVSQPVVYYTYPTVYAAPVYYAVTVVAPPPPVYAYPPVYAVPSQVVVTAPTPTVVRYPHGRYELRGDGVTTPYFWVWIPNPPPPPASQPSGQ